VNSDQSNSIILFFLYRIVQSFSQDGGCTAADCSSVNVELLDPTTCKCTGLVEHCVWDCVAVRRLNVFFFSFTHIPCSGKFGGH